MFLLLGIILNHNIGVFDRVLILHNTSQNISKSGACLTCKLHGLAIRDHSDFINWIFFVWIFRVLILLKRIFNLLHGLLKSVFFWRLWTINQSFLKKKTSHWPNNFNPICMKKTCCWQKLKITWLKKPVIVNNNKKLQTNLFEVNLLLSKNLQTNLFEVNLLLAQAACVRHACFYLKPFKPICLKKTCQCQK